MHLKYFDFLKNKFEIRNVYLIYGEENFFKEQVMKKIISHDLLSNMENIDVFEAKEINKSILSGLLNTFSLFSEKKIVVIKNVDEMETEIKDYIIEYLKNPSQFSYLILIAKEITNIREIEKEINKIGYLIRSSIDREEELIKWISNKIMRAGKKMDDIAISYFLNLTGRNLYLIDMELEKIINYIREGTVVNKAVIDEVIIPHIESRIFDLVDSLCEKNTTKALGLLSNLLQMKEEPVKIIFLIARQIRLILQAKFLLNQGYLSDKKYLQKDELKNISNEVFNILPEKENILKQHSFVINKCIKQSKYFSESKLIDALRTILECDLSLKGIKDTKDKKLSLELMILNLCC